VRFVSFVVNRRRLGRLVEPQAENDQIPSDAV
jgi:hypothetical protein